MGEETELEEEAREETEMSFLQQSKSIPAGGSRYKVNIHP